MKYEDFGIDPRTKRHNKAPLTAAESVFLGIIWVDHVGRGNCISANEFARRYAGRLHMTETHAQVKREIRKMQNHLITEHNIPIYSQAGHGGGYWIGETAAEGHDFYDTFRKRGLTGLVKASRGKKSAMVDMVTQLSFEWRDLMASAGMVPDTKDDAAAPVEIVDAFLKKMLSDPEKFASGLRKLGEKYGSVLIPRKRFDAMIGAIKARAAELQDLARSLEV